MSLDGYKNYFIVEITFILNLIYWAWSRLYIFPYRIIKSILPHDFIIKGTVHIKFPLFSICNYCRILLIFLYCLHCWWFFLRFGPFARNSCLIIIGTLRHLFTCLLSKSPILKENLD